VLYGIGLFTSQSRAAGIYGADANNIQWYHATQCGGSFQAKIVGFHGYAHLAFSTTCCSIFTQTSFVAGFSERRPVFQ